MATYSGFFRPKNPAKYSGDYKNIIYRSLWERNVFRWCDENPQILKWVSEEVVIPYYYPLDKKIPTVGINCKIFWRATEIGF